MSGRLIWFFSIAKKSFTIRHLYQIISPDHIELELPTFAGLERAIRFATSAVKNQTNIVRSSETYVHF